MKLKIDYLKDEEKDIESYIDIVKDIDKELRAKNERFLDWIDWPLNYDKEEFNRILTCAERIKEDSEVLVVIGIGGSYLGARAVIEALSHTFSNMLSKDKRKYPQVLFVGNNISSTYLSDLVDLIGDRDYSVNVISKSGTTTEPAIAFRYFKKMLEDKYGSGAKERIYVTTDEEKGALKELANKEGYESFVIPDDIGGRYSVLTAVGLLPIAVAGIDIKRLINGAYLAYEEYNNGDLLTNDCYKYAVLRNVLYKQDKNIEMLITYEPKMHYMIEWWKQLYGESEGKDNKGIFPTGAEFTTDLHSLGQYIQEGRRNIFETVIDIDNSEKEIIIGEDEDNLDGLNYLSGKSMAYVNKKAMEGTINAHVDGGVPNMILTIDRLDEENIGRLIYFFELACGMSGKILGVNPFNQPGVEKYKTNMFKLLEKPGYKE